VDTAAVVVLFWLPVGLFCYHWLVFPLLLWLFSRKARDTPSSVLDPLPRVTIAVAVRNEERLLEGKIRNCLRMDYPADKLEILFGSDASTDATDRILGGVGDPRVSWFRLQERGGKTRVLNELLSRATGDLVLVTDADILLDAAAVRLLVRWFASPDVGIVQAHYRRVNTDGSPAEGLFDRWETAVKRLEGRIGALPTVNGMGAMLRRDLWTEMPTDTIHDDLLMGLRLLKAGYRAIYDPDAVATCQVETESTEFRRRVKMGRGNMQALCRNAGLLSPKHGCKAWTYLSHKVIRSLLPFCLPLMLAGCAVGFSSSLYVVLLGVQLLCYATIPLLLMRTVFGPVLLPQYFLFMNIALLAGNLSYIFGFRPRHWERTQRS